MCYDTQPLDNDPFDPFHVLSIWWGLRKPHAQVLTPVFLRRGYLLFDSGFLAPAMEVVGAAASISQLAVYIYSAATRVRHLYQASQSSAFSTKGQLEELEALLKILDRIYNSHAPSDSEFLIPILINIAETAQKLYNWLNHAGTISQRLMLFVRNVEVEETFRILHQKCNLLLVFHYSERNQCALNRIEDSLRMSSRNLSEDADKMSSAEKDKRPFSQVGFPLFQ